MHLRLKTKLVIAITAMVVALVTGLSYAYVAQLVHERVEDAYKDGDFVAHQIFNAARQALELDLSDFDQTTVDPNDPDEIRKAIQDSLQSDPGLNNLLQSVVGYQLEIYDAAIVDTNGVAILHTDAILQNKPMAPRADFDVVRKMNLWRQIKMLYGPQKVYDIDLPLTRAGKPFGQIRVGIQTIFLQHDLKPQLNRTFEFAGLSILISFLLAAALSNFALRPLEAISKRLDRLSAGEIDAAPDTGSVRQDEVTVVTSKINRLGRQMRDVQEVFSALKENLDQIMGNLQDGLMLFTHDERIVLVSASAERFVGRMRSEILGKSVYEVFTPETRLGRLVLDGFELHQTIDGREIETDSKRVQVSLDFIEEGGQKIGALLTMRDVESVHRIEDEIELSRRLAAIGRLTSGVAHEVRNPINAIMVHLQIMREKIQQIDPESRRHMDVIASEIQRLGRVVQTLLDFTKPVELRLVETDLRRLTEEVAMLAAPEAARHGVIVQTDLPDGPLPVKVDADLVKQAVLNIANNGIQAMPNGGTLMLSGRHEDGTVQIDIADQGAGIPPELSEKVFNLYFTTKKSGTGIGLAMSYRVMQLHNGDVSFDSRPGLGTTFHLRFPAQEQARTATRREGAQVSA
jgi:PAS domain S-box-containing protein